MKLIEKNSEPKELSEYRKKKDSYKNFSQKQGKGVVQQSLLDEQGFICAYCIKRIDIKTIRIEHWEPQSIYPKQVLIYE